MAYTALYRKWRPSRFEDVRGQEHIVRTLKNQIEAGRIGHAYLFCGTRGTGKTSVAKILARAVNCEHPVNGSPCNECAACRSILDGTSVDVAEIDAASNNGVDNIREIREQVQYSPTQGKYRVYIIDEVHMLSAGAFNALLKTLEEPPEFVRFIFATTEGDKVLPTIISRCQRFDLRRIQTTDIVSRLKHVCAQEGIAAEDDALLAIARGAEGGMRDALSSLDQLISFCGDKVTEEDALGVFGLVSRSALEKLAGAILSGDIPTILSSIETFDSAGKNMRRLSGELLQHFRNLVVLQALGPNSKSLEATPEQIKVLTEQVKGLDAGRVFRVCDQIAEMEDKLRYALSVRTLIEMSLIRASRIATTATIEELMRAVRALKGEQGAGSVPKAEPVPARRAVRELPSLPPEPASAPASAGSSRVSPPSSPVAPPPPPRPMPRKEILEDARLNSVLEVFPGAEVVDVKEVK